MTRSVSKRSDRRDRRGDPGDRVGVLGVLGGKELPPRVAYAVAAEAWRRAVEATAEPALGLVAAQLLVAGDYGLLEFLLRSSPNLRVAAERLGRFHRLMNDGADAQLSMRAQPARLRYVGPASLAMPRAYAEYVLATWVRIARESTDESSVVTAVHLPFPAPRGRRAYRDSFGAKIVFDSPHAELLLDAEILERPLVGADAQLTAMLEQHAETLLASRAPGNEWSQRVAEALRPRLADGTPRLSAIAAALAVSERVLRRRLEDEGTSFSSVVEDLRRGLALKLVGDPSLSLGEIAFLLGFSEPSAFHRAFRRWTGRTPRSAAKP